MRTPKDHTALFLVGTITVAFGVILWPYYEPIIWALVIAIIFAPLNRRLAALLSRRRTAAALSTLLIIIAIVILPALLISSRLLQEAYALYESLRSGELDVGATLQHLRTALPGWALDMLHRYGLSSTAALQERLSAALMSGSSVLAARLVNIGQSTFDFVVSLGVMLYLLFFLLRDGDTLAQRINEAIPIDPDQRAALLRKFATVVRATVKGDILVAAAQGLLGGIMFWFLGITPALLWAVLMGFFALLPAIGSALVWLPASIYLLATGTTWKGVLLIAYGTLVISVADNVLRPILVAKDAKMPDYVVLISTLGGLALFGATGLVVGPVIAAMFISIWDIFVVRPREELSG